MSSLLPSILGGSDESPDDESVDAMPVHALIGVLQDLRHDIDSIEVDVEQHETILEEIEQLDEMVPGKEADHKIEAYPPEERTVMWLEWLEDRLAQADIEDTELHPIIEERVIAVGDTVDAELPIDPSTTDTTRWEYQYTEIDAANTGHYEMFSDGVRYDVLEEVLEEFREDHSEHLADGEVIEDQPNLSGEGQSAEWVDVDSSTTDQGNAELAEPNPTSVVQDDETECESVTEAELKSPEESEERDGRAFTDRLSALGSRVSSISGLVGHDDSTAEVEAENPDAADSDAIAPAEDDDKGLASWKINLLENDPAPHEVDAKTIERLIEAGYITEDGSSPDVETFAGENAREMLEVHEQRPNDPIWLGRGTDGHPASLDQSAMFLHMMIAGKSGYGKSTQLTNMLLQIIRAGYGCVFYDPGGDDSKKLMEKIPDHRMDDVVWIEPGRKEGHSTGFNFLEVGLDEDDPNYDKAVENLVDDLAKTLGQGDYWGPRMNSVSRSLIRAMNYSKHDFNLLDLSYVLLDEESRHRFREIIAQEEVDCGFLDDSMKDIAEMDDDDLKPLRRRFKQWKESSIARRLIAFRDGGVNIGEAVENDKIIIVRMGQEKEDLKQMLMMAVLRRVWAAIRAREDQNERDRDPFFVVMDEFHNMIADDETDSTIPTMFREARKYRLSLIVADQYFSEIPQNVLSGVYTNTDTVASFNPGHIDQAREVASTFDIDSQDLLNEGKFKSWTRLTDSDGNKTPAFKVNNLAPYPPIRRREEAENRIEQSLRRYGRNLTAETIRDDLNFRAGRGELEVRGIAGDEGTTEMARQKQGEQLRDTLFEAIYVTQIKQDAKGGFVPMEDVEDEWSRRSELGYQSKPAQVLEKTAEEYVVQENRSDGLYVRITPDGLKEAGLQQDTGENASGGGPMHRWVLTQAFECFTVWDCFVTLPDQSEEGELPDGVADLPIDPLKEAKERDDLPAVQQALDELKADYPALYDLTGGRNIAIEAETRTIADPQQTLTNLRKAVNNGRLCVLAVKPPTKGGRAPDSAEFDYWVERGEQIIYKTKRNGTHVKSINRGEITCVKQTTEEGHRQFYNASALTLEGDQIYPLRPATDENVEWWERNGEVVVETASGEEVARFEDVRALEEPDKGAFPAYAVREDGGVTVYEGGSTHEYEDMDMMEDDWQTISEPFIPELEFNRGLPSKDDFVFVVYPFADSEADEPMIVEGDERRPLLPEDRAMPTGEIDGNQRGPKTGEDDAESSENDDAGEDKIETVDEDSSLKPDSAAGNNRGGDSPENAQQQTGADITRIEDLQIGHAAAICGEIQSVEPPTTVKQPNWDSVEPIRMISVKDDSGEVTVRLWGRHAEYEVEVGKEVLIAGATMGQEIENGTMQRILNVHSSATVVEAPDSISSGLGADTTSPEGGQIAVSDGAISEDQTGESNEPTNKGTDQDSEGVVDEAPDIENNDDNDVDDGDSGDDNYGDDETLLP